MKKYIEIENGVIIGCGEIDIDELPVNYTEITGDLYSKITNLPAEFTMNTEGEIIDVTPYPRTPEPPEKPTKEELLEQRVQATEDAILAIMMGGA